MRHKSVIAVLVAIVMALSVIGMVGVTTASKAVASPNYSSSITKHYLKIGYGIIKPFRKTILKTGLGFYIGTVRENGQVYVIEVVPRNSHTSAVTFRDQLINGFKRDGYRTYTVDKKGVWTGVKGNEEWSVGAGYSPVTRGYSTTLGYTRI